MPWKTNEHRIPNMVEVYREELYRDTEAFWVDDQYVNDVIEWCEDNLDDDCWCFEEGLSADCYYIRGDENIVAFKLRWC